MGRGWLPRASGADMTGCRDRLTVLTPTGQRALDLGSIKRVWLARAMNRYRRQNHPDLLFVTDGRRVRVALTSEAAYAAVARSVTPRTRVSLNARSLLVPEPMTFLRGATLMLLSLAFGAVFLAVSLVLMAIVYWLAFP